MVDAFGSNILEKIMTARELQKLSDLVAYGAEKAKLHLELPEVTIDMMLTPLREKAKHTIITKLFSETIGELYDVMERKEDNYLECMAKRLGMCDETIAVARLLMAVSQALLLLLRKTFEEHLTFPLTEQVLDSLANLLPPLETSWARGVPLLRKYEDKLREDIQVLESLAYKFVKCLYSDALFVSVNISSRNKQEEHSELWFKPQPCDTLLRRFIEILYEVAKDVLSMTLRELIKVRRLYTWMIEKHASGRLPEAFVDCQVSILEDVMPKGKLLSKRVFKAADLREGIHTQVALFLRRIGWKVGSLMNLLDALHEKGLLDHYRGLIARYEIKELWPKNGRLLVVYKGRHFDASLLGDGLLAVMQLYTGIAYASKKPTILLIEEPETGLHPGYMTTLVVDLIKVAKVSNSYVVMSTHSLELIRTLLRAAEELKTLDKVKVVLMRDGRIVVEVSGPIALKMVKEFDAELRGL